MTYSEKTNEELCRLAKKRNKDAMAALYENNIGLLNFVMGYVAAAYMIKIRDKEDFLQIGFIGIHKAVRKYSPKRGASFATYAKYWILREMAREAQRIVDRKEVWYGIAREEKTADAEDEFRANPEEKHDRLKGYSFYSRPECQAIWNMMYEDMFAALERISERLRVVLKLHYGIDREDGLSYSKISEEYNCHLRRVKQMVHDGLNEMRREMQYSIFAFTPHIDLIIEIRKRVDELAHMLAQSHSPESVKQDFSEILEMTPQKKLPDSA